MKRFICGILSLIMLLSAVVAGFNAYANERQITVKYCQTDARSMLSMVNSFRTGSDAWYWSDDNSQKVYATGLSGLTYDYTLERAAMQRAAELVEKFDHTRPDGSSCFTVINLSDYLAVGENIAAGYSSVQSAFAGWQESGAGYAGQGHRRNMLDSNYKAIGIACVEYNGTKYWVQEFGGRVADSTSTPALDGMAKVTMSANPNTILPVDASNTTQKPTTTTTKPYSTAVTTTKPTTKAPVVSKPKKASLSSVSAGKKQFKVKWKKISGVSGYQIQYSTSSKFTKKTTKTATVKGNKTFTKTIKKLSSKKKYYVRVRAYKTVNGKQVNGDWSTSKSVKTK